MLKLDWRARRWSLGNQLCQF